MTAGMSLNEHADALERKMSDELDVLISKSPLFNMADGKLGAVNPASKGGKYQLMDDDPRLPKMPAKPTLLDYFTCRASGINHMLQSATHALKASMPEKTILACLLHDIGYAYPEMYIKHFGRDYEPDDYIKEAYKRARDHKWYMSARMITVHDIYSFDPNAAVSWEPFEDIVGRNFKQPKEGLGFDNSPVAHMWRTIRRPTKYL